ncbi:conserved hypothetical protein [Culex quinquefasciatus]|uniref:Uncharacterized protein n=1 Tax=Culex quinquefasciatus TaxID=7176 RepID=B0VYZ2_CULQU|nr:conserved hypothetical protein [Culex quinquefasciatus]|eukprot:XP_001841783.1 conserved hypothetical protein [Culex quinquefasciatus]
MNGHDRQRPTFSKLIGFVIRDKSYPLRQNFSQIEEGSGQLLCPQKQNSGFLAQLNARIAPNKQPQQQSSPQHYQQQHQQEQPAYTYTSAPSNEPVYHRGNVPDQRSSYNNSTSSNPHHQQQQMLLQQQQQQSTAASHGMYSSGPAQHHHQQQRDGKNQVYSSTHSQNQQQIQQQQQYYYQAQSNYATQNIYVSTNPFAAAAAATGSPVHSTYSPSSFGKMPRDGQTSSAAASSSGLPTPVVTNVSSIGHDLPGHGHHHHNRSMVKTSKYSKTDSGNRFSRQFYIKVSILNIVPSPILAKLQRF